MFIRPCDQALSILVDARKKVFNVLKDGCDAGRLDPALFEAWDCLLRACLHLGPQS